jgi:hypothetical protein
MFTTLVDITLIDETASREAATLRFPKNVRLKNFATADPEPAAPTNSDPRGGPAS